MTSSRVSTNFAYNVLGVLVPLALTIVTTPIYLRYIGQERFGVLALIWVVVGYFGLLDLGLSRASANRLARTISQHDTSSIFWAAIWTSAFLGCAGAAALLFSGFHWGHLVFKDSPGLQAELFVALPFMSLFIPLATTSGVMIGALESRHAFLSVNAIAIGGSVLFTILPLVAALTITPSLAVLIPAATISRIVTVVWLGWSTSRVLSIRTVDRPKRTHVRDLLAYGGWAAISTFVGTIMNSVDQLAIGAVLGAAAVAHYVVPYNVVMRLAIIPSALLRALFPKLSRVDAHTARELEYSALRSLCVAMTSICVILVFCMRPLLELWLRSQLAPVSIPIAIVLSVGVWFNAMANVPYWTLQAQGRPDVPAKFHLFEVGPYLVGLFLAMHFFGLIGAATAWSLRMGMDSLLLFYGSHYQSKRLFPLASGALLLLGSAICALVMTERVWLFSTGAFAVFLTYMWARIVDPTLITRIRILTRQVLSRPAAKAP